MRLSAWTATATSVARRPSVCARNSSPITCFLLMRAINVADGDTIMAIALLLLSLALLANWGMARMARRYDHP